MGKGQFQPSARGKGERRHKGSTRSQKDERRAHRILEIWAQRPSMRAAEIKAMIREEFECGIVASENAMQRAYALYEELRDDETLVARLSAAYLDLAEEAKRAGDFNAARRAYDSLRAHLGLGAPERVEHSGSIGSGPSKDEELEPLSDEQLALLAVVDGGGHAKVH